MMIAVPGDAVSERVISLLGSLTNSIIGDTGKGTETSKTDEQRYRDVFGNVTEVDIQALNQFLEGRVEQAKQETTSKEVALTTLQSDLAKRFSKRIL